MQPMWLYNENQFFLIYDVERTTIIDGMGPFNVAGIESFVKTSQPPYYSWIIHVVPVIPYCSE